jgi:hypothetical protein
MLEKEAVDFVEGCENEETLALVVQTSIAISLKRVADILDGMSDDAAIGFNSLKQIADGRSWK